MILYNIAVNIQDEVETEWVQWMQSNHIPDVMATSFFNDYRFYRILGKIE